MRGLSGAGKGAEKESEVWEWVSVGTGASSGEKWSEGDQPGGSMSGKVLDTWTLCPESTTGQALSSRAGCRAMNPGSNKGKKTHIREFNCGSPGC